MARSHSEIYESSDIEPHLYPIDDDSLIDSICDGCGERFLEVCETSEGKLVIFEVWENNRFSAFCSRNAAANYIHGQELERDERDARWAKYSF